MQLNEIERQKTKFHPNPESEPYKPLTSCNIFSPLPKAVLQSIWNAGTVIQVTKGDLFHASSLAPGFINVILEGVMKVANHTPHEKQFTERSKNSVFGPIDAILGRGSFRLVVALTDCQVFVLRRDAVKALFDLHPEFHRLISLLHSAVAVSIAEKFEKRLITHYKLSNENLSKDKTRVAPRLSVIEQNFIVTLSTNEVRKIDNLSISGICIEGKTDHKLHDEISFVFEGSVFNEPPISLKGEIIRIDNESFSVRLNHFEPGVRSAWENVVMHALSFDIDQSFQLHLFELNEQLTVTYQTDGHSFEGELKSLGPDGALLHTQHALQSKIISLQLNLDLPNGTKESLTLSTVVINILDEGYVLQFRNLSLKARYAIEEFLTEQSDFKKNPFFSKSHVEEQEVTAKNLIIDQEDQLISLYFDDIKRGVVSVTGEKDFKVGDIIGVIVEWNPKMWTEHHSHQKFHLLGRVVRIDSQHAYVVLENSCRPDISAMKTLVESLSRHKLDHQFIKIGNIEHNWKARRYIQLTLILGLLIACITWAVHRVIQLKSHENVEIIDVLPAEENVSK